VLVNGFTWRRDGSGAADILGMGEQAYPPPERLRAILRRVERVGGLQCFKKAQQEIYDESDSDLKQVRPLAVGEVAIHGSCLDTLCCSERFQAGRSGQSTPASEKMTELSVSPPSERQANSCISVGRLSGKVTKLARLSPSANRHKKTPQAVAEGSG
jgi:hypothetical protein